MNYSSDSDRPSTEEGMSASGSPLPPDTWNYEATVIRVEAILAQIESGDLELAAVFDQFAIAVDYLQQCEAFLNEHQKQVDLLIETLTDNPDF